jgi:predicted Zn-dependent peptidase
MYNRDVLDDGTIIVSEKLPNVRSIALGLWVGVGGRDEGEANLGVSHLTEHMLFKGTKKRSARDIAEAIDGVGGQLDAFTTKEHTCFYARTLDQHLPLALEILWDMFNNSVLKPEDLEREKGVILEEINMYEDNPDEQIHDLLMAAIWDGHPLSYSILGTPETVSRITREALADHIHKYYRPENTIIAVAGNVEHGELVKLCREYSIDRGEKKFYNQRKTAVPTPRVLIKSKPTEQVHIMVGVPGIRRTHPAKYALSIIDNVLGGSMSSRLFQRLREERGLVYNVYSDISLFSDTGAFAIYAGTGSTRVQEVIQVICGELRDLRKNGISQAEMARAKEHLKGTFLLGMESTTVRMNRLGFSEVCGEPLCTPDEVIQKIGSVSLDDVAELVEELFREELYGVAIIGPEGEGDVVKEWIR